MSESIELESNLLKDKNILIGVTGSCASYKSVDLCREARKHGGRVRFVVTRNATKFITVNLLRWACNDIVYYPDSEEGIPMHVQLSEWCDLFCIYPCTLNTLSKIVNGITDNPVSLCAVSCMGLNKRILIVPAMSLSMWNSPITRRIIRELLTLSNVDIVEPEISADKAKLASPDRVVEKMIDLTNVNDLENRKVLITAGSTREYIDPIKYITTPSSGLTGAYFAREAVSRGAEVYLVCGYMSTRARELLRDLYSIHILNVKTTRDMYNTVREICDNIKIDIAIFSAAPLDFELIERFESKIDTDKIDRLNISLVKAPKVIEAADNVKVKIVFKAEWNVNHDTLVKRSMLRMYEHNIDIVVAHDVSRGLGFETIRDSVLILDRYGLIRRLENVHKRELARKVLTLASKIL